MQSPATERAASPETVPGLKGYARTAQLMAKFDEFAIFRRFKRHNLQNLLYLQAQILYQEEELDRVVRRDATSPGRERYTGDWWALSHGEDHEGKEQWRLIKALRETLDKYNDALLKQQYLAKLDQPNDQDLAFLRSWFERPSMGWFPIRGIDRGAWDAEHEDDLVALNPRVPPDMLSRWFNRVVFPFLHRHIGERLKDPESGELGDGIYVYRESRLKRATDMLVTVVAALLPLASTVVLYVLPNDRLRLGVMVVFSAAFALALTFMTSARRIEVFAATAAYAAVNVVFLSGASPWT